MRSMFRHSQCTSSPDFTALGRSLVGFSAAVVITLLILSPSAAGQSGGGNYGSGSAKLRSGPANEGPQSPNLGSQLKDDGNPPTPPPPPGDVVTPAPSPESTAAKSKNRSPATPRSSTTGSGGMRKKRRRASADFNRWEVWWERNKFNVFNLRKIYDQRPVQLGENAPPQSEHERLAAIECYKQQVVVPMLQALAGHDHFDVRSAAAISLGKVHASESIPTLANLCQDRSDVVKASALFGLGLLEEARATYILLNLAHNSRYGQDVLGCTKISDDDRGYAALAMALRKKRITGKGLNQFFDCWRSIDPDLLVLLVEASGVEGKSNTIPCLTRLIEDTKISEMVRATAITSLGKIGDPCLVPFVSNLLDNKSLDIRRSAAIALGSLATQGHSDAIQKMIHILDKENDLPMRGFLALSLGQIGGKRVKDGLLKAFKNGASSTVKPWYALGLGLACRITQDSDAVQALTEELDDESNSHNRAAYALALGIIARDDSGPTLVEAALEAKDPFLKSYATLALGLLGQPQYAATITKIMLSASDPMVIRNAALGLGVLGDSGSIQDLMELIKRTSNPYIQSYAAIALGIIGDFQVAETLIQVASDPQFNPISVAYAVNALGILFDHERTPALAQVAQNSNYLLRVRTIEWLLNIGI